MSLSSWSDTNCPRLATNSVEQGGWGCCWLGGEGSAGEGRNGRPCGPSVNVGWKRANPNMILLRIVPSPQATQNYCVFCFVFFCFSATQTHNSHYVIMTIERHAHDVCVKKYCVVRQMLDWKLEGGIGPAIRSRKRWTDVIEDGHMGFGSGRMVREEWFTTGGDVALIMKTLCKLQRQ